MGGLEASFVGRMLKRAAGAASSGGKPPPGGAGGSVAAETGPMRAVSSKAVPGGVEVTFSNTGSVRERKAPPLKAPI